MKKIALIFSLVMLCLVCVSCDSSRSATTTSTTSSSSSNVSSSSKIGTELPTTTDVASQIRALEEERATYENAKSQLIQPETRIECTTCSDPDNLANCERCGGSGSVVVGSNVVACSSCALSKYKGKVNCTTCGGLGKIDNPYYDSEYYTYKTKLDEYNAKITELDQQISKLSA